jgi:hypothetical protein
LGYWLRLLRPDHNPLRRASDRVEAAVVAGLAAALLAGVPLAALSAAWWGYDAGVRTQHAQTSWRQVPAVLLANAATAPAGPGSSALRSVPATWTAPDGARRTGPVRAPVSARAGTAVRVWVDASGGPAGPPFQHGQVVSLAALAALLASAGAGLVLLGAGRLARHMLDHGRLSAWDAEWQAIGPRWTTQHE